MATKPRLHHKTQKYLEKLLNSETDMVEKLRDTLKEIANSKLNNNLQSISKEITNLCKKKDVKDMAASGRRLCESICLYFVSDEEINRTAQNRARGPDFNGPDFNDLSLKRKINILSNISELNHHFPKDHMHCLREHGNDAVHAQKQKEDQKENDSNEEQQEDPEKKAMRNIIQCVCQIMEWFWIKVQLRDLDLKFKKLDLRMTYV
eukprot:156618_1